MTPAAAGADEAALARAVARCLDSAGRPATLTRLGSGRANDTYLARSSSRAAIVSVLPPGRPGDARRRHAVLAAVAERFPLAPRPLGFCDDPAACGATFVIMERCDGVLPSTLDLDPPLLRRLSESFVEVLASLHRIEVPRGDGPDDFLRRTIAECNRRWQETRAEGGAEVDRVVAWLLARVPAAPRLAFLHNDYKLDNVLVDPGDPARITAVLDWELSAIGDPLADLGVALAYWVEPGDPPLLRLEAPGPSSRPGALTRRELVASYARRTGVSVDDLAFYEVYGLLRLAVLTAQLDRRGSQQRGRLILPLLLARALGICGGGAS